MPIDLHLQTKLEDNQVKIAQVLDITEDAFNREVICLLIELKNITRYLENILYEEWEDDFLEK
jgi:hypothetical protein